jgi:hypothetical protein
VKNKISIFNPNLVFSLLKLAQDFPKHSSLHTPMNLAPPPSLPAHPRCSSPVLPGAWPLPGSTTPSHLRHERSSTYPPPSRPGSVSPSTPLHLDRVTTFHQRLSLSLSQSSGSHSSCIPFSTSVASDGVFMPSDSMPGSIISTDDSDLTRFTQVRKFL